MPIRLVIADDHPIILQGLRGLFSSASDVDVLACCSNGQDAIDAVGQHTPDVLLIDLKMEGLSGLDVARVLKHKGASCQIVILTAAVRDEEVADALELGVAGLVLKDSPPDAVVECVRQVSQGRPWIDPDTLGRAMAVARSARKSGDTPESTLTPRELELIKLVAEGMRNKEIASKLSITEGTVKIHLHNIYDKLGVDGRVELVLAAQAKRLL